MPPKQPSKPILLISYSPLDEPEQPGEGEVRWLSFVVGRLRPAEKYGAVEMWLDRLTPGRDDWGPDSERKLRACDVFILLVSNNAMASASVVDKEIAIIEDRRMNGEEVYFYPLLLTPTNMASDQLRDRKLLRPRDGQAFSKFSSQDRHEKMSEVADEIFEIAGRIVARRGKYAEPGSRRPVPEFLDRSTLRAWLAGEDADLSIAIASRAALRVVPLLRIPESIQSRGDSPYEFISLLSMIFRLVALSRGVAKYPTRAKSFSEAAKEAVTEASRSTRVAVAAVLAAADAALAFPGVFVASAAAAAAAEYASGAAAVIWSEIRADIAALQSQGVDTLLDLPLWERSAPSWVTSAWTKVRATLPTDTDWGIWTQWYEERLKGGSRGEGFEVVFATVPTRVWKEGPAPVNAWIKTHLPKESDAWPELPPPLSDRESPFSYVWTAALQVAAIAGPQNLPSYPYFDSEEHHSRALEACRKGAERLLKALREGGRYNVQPEYAEALRYYLKDLPKAAGEGNILLANDQAVNLREMFAQDLETLPAAFAAPLRRVIENQFALNAFYDLVKKHQDAIATSELTRPFPAEAARRFFDVVEGETPRFFEPPVGEGLRDVERAAPPVALAPDETRPSTAIQPPPLPPGTPDPRQSHERQIATAANALWETFLKGKDLPVAIEAWTQAAQKLGHAVGPLLDFLRGIGS